jgi:hypothetical protein
MIEPMTPEQLAMAEEQFEKILKPLVAKARMHPPQFDRIAPPIDVADVLAHCTGGLYEGFEEDVKRMRRGQLPLGPRE